MTIKKNYKNKHLLIASLSIIAAAFTIIPFNVSNFFVTTIQVIPVILFSGPYEKVDELVENNLNKANKYIMILLLIALIIFSLLVNNKVTIAPNIFAFTACTAVGFRSILFIWFDRNLNIGKGE